MASLHFKSLMCIDTEDITGSDETHLVVSGTTRWRGRMNDGDAVSLNVVKPIPFINRARIDLFDDDHPDPDDHVGTTYALLSEIGKGEIEHTFKYNAPLGSAKYVLTPWNSRRSHYCQSNSGHRTRG